VTVPTSSAVILMSSTTGVATVLSGDERDRLFAEEVRMHPALGRYQETTSRTIPVIAIAPRG
jgi:F420H(2)-dependent quinone reductase